MRLLRILLHTWLYLPYGFRKVSGTGPFAPGAVRVNGPGPGNDLKQALWAHHVKQYNEASCSVASVATAINALGSIQGSGYAPIDQLGLLEKVRTARWKERMSEAGDNGRRGLPLAMLAVVVKSSLDICNIGYQRVECLQANKAPRGSRQIQAVLRSRLSAFERSGRCLLIAHFDQGAFVPTLNIPHISPVGAYDSKSREVTVLDVDPEQETPYRIPFDRFYTGLASDYHGLFKPFGYESGGAVCIHLY